MRNKNMFIDGREVANDQIFEADICIIGAGAAGITMARRFAGKSWKIALVESGGLDFDSNTQDLYKGYNKGTAYPPIHVSRMRFFGGTTSHWSGRSGVLDSNDFRRREWIPHSGWPINEQDLSAYYGQASTICQLTSDKFDMATNDSPANEPYLLTNSTIHTKIFHNSPPTRFGVTYREEISTAENIETFLHSNIQEFETNENANVVNSARIRSLQGNEYRINAKYFVLATGGIENARILLLSNKTQKNGLGNEHDIVGRYFNDHPHVIAGLWFPTKKLNLQLYSRDYANGNRGWLGLSDAAVRKERVCNYLVNPKSTSIQRHSDAIKSAKKIYADVRKGEWPDDLDTHIMNMVRDIDELYDAVKESFSSNDKSADAGVYALVTNAEIAPNPESRVTLSDELDAFGQNRLDVNLQYSELDRHTLIRGTELIGNALASAGLGRTKILLDEDQPWPDGTGFGFHHMGTTRMHNDPKQGVVDSNCKVHGVSNLYVAGSSVFTTSGVGVPTLTIIALALRLADHLHEQLRYDA